MYDKGENSQNSRLVPMFRSKQVVDRLDRVESFDRHLYEDRIPVAHRAVPQSGQLKCLKLTPILTLLRDESRVTINKVRQMVLMTVRIAQRTDYVAGIEVRTLLE